MSIPYDPSPPLVTPAQVLKEQCERQGVPAEALRLPPVLVGTFQGASFSHLIARVGAAQPSSRSDGTAIETGVTVGKTPGGDPIAVARLPAGAPAAVIALEEAIARGVRSILVVGSSGSLQPDLPIGSTVIVTEAVREEGTPCVPTRRSLSCWHDAPGLPGSNRPRARHGPPTRLTGRRSAQLSGTAPPA